MATGDFTAPEEERVGWLGSGLYFFEENIELAMHYADIAAQKRGGQPAVLKAAIDLRFCLDMTTRLGQMTMRNAYRVLGAQWAKDGGVITQRPFDLLDGQVRAGYSGDWAGGKNGLDHAVIEKAVELAHQQKNQKLDTVRGIFIEEGPLYDTSWIFEGAHVAIAVRNTTERVLDAEVVTWRSE